jgi:polysaccharide export outer membrane protein
MVPGRESCVNSRNLNHICGVVVVLAFLAVLWCAAPCGADDYRIGSQDVLKITVYEHPDLTTETRVSEDGRLTFPLIGDVPAKGLSPRQLEAAIAGRLSGEGFINSPQVNVFVLQYRGQRVTILGEVMKPGQYDLSGPTTILDLMSLALGVTPNGGYQITVFRKEQGADGAETTRKIPVDIDRLLNSGDLSQNLLLTNRDVIHVPKAVFYVYGEVNRPGAYRVEKGITVRRAVSLAGGLTPKGSHRVEITRREADAEKRFSADIDDLVQVDDVVRIKESIF